MKGYSGKYTTQVAPSEKKIEQVMPPTEEKTETYSCGCAKVRVDNTRFKKKCIKHGVE